jgi:hypothetical protein
VLDRFPVNPVHPAQDGDRARAFYPDVLGLDRDPLPYPVVSFLVEDIALNELVGG